MELRIHRFPGGWSVSDGSFAAFAGTRDEALQRYERQVPTSRVCHAANCGDDASVMLDGVALCLTHYNNFRSRAGAAGVEDRLAGEVRREEATREIRRRAGR
jgi:hypothetical protein